MDSTVNTTSWRSPAPWCWMCKQFKTANWMLCAVLTFKAYSCWDKSTLIDTAGAWNVLLDPRSGLWPDTFQDYLQFTSCVLRLSLLHTKGGVDSANCSHVFGYLMVIDCTVAWSHKSSIVLCWIVTLSPLQLISRCVMALFHIMLIAINAQFNINGTPNFRAGLSQ